MHTVNSIGDSVDTQSAAAIIKNLVSSNTLGVNAARVLMTAVGDNALAPVAPGDRGRLRARILKLCLLELSE
jgi:transcriptional regulator CtsR